MTNWTGIYLPALSQDHNGDCTQCPWSCLRCSEPPIIALPPRRSYPVTLDIVAIERGQPRIVEPAEIGE